ncbi:hypothetical protein GP486_004203 [Trichoglossum hirsutum]|uniref:Uncharacterized protein n=1 Tax=Trichoglossum hirsutum TaxID=265104 RepID=A0A9P8LBH4_9PEZI|nr:hypothetical protein GP486_004203 [Trichoglossum hirsutum]
MGILALPSERSGSFMALYNMGVGTVTSDSLIGIDFAGRGPGGLLANVLLANAPQGVLSFLYLTYNGIFTCMLNADEWSRFAHQRKFLRVTSPSGKQRSTYYLQLPYTYALPLLALSGTLHWLVSQSIFLARINTSSRDSGEDLVYSTSTCGFSCIAIIFVIIVGSVAVFGGIGMGFRRYPAGIPLAGGCSAAISAACHPLPNENVDAPFLPLQWGVVSQGHCSFDAGLVEKPKEGQSFSGVRKRVPTAGNRIDVS